MFCLQPPIYKGLLPIWRSCYHSEPCQVTLAKGIQALGGTLFLGPGRREGIVRGAVGHVLLGAPHYCLHITDKVWAEP